MVDRNKINDFDYPNQFLDQQQKGIELSEMIDEFETKIDYSLQSEKKRHKILNEDD